ncbi:MULTISPECIES: substrate-binding domain-containing protein [Paenibacillus]|uniref:substrate-binding domain-containing protein n=1 Tax=Paenibacillus TaxID=44249 RepID=UPI000312C273|nr:MULTISPECIES: substrate-binding domain-containing protein [unclassified Paenibacillus]
MESKAGFRSATERKQGFLESLLAHGLSLPAEYQVAGDYSIDSGYRMMNALLDLKEPPTLVFCANDDMAIGAMNVCFARGGERAESGVADRVRRYCVRWIHQPRLDDHP